VQGVCRAIPDGAAGGRCLEAAHCDPLQGQGEERCNGEDDDCDGLPDDGLTRDCATVCGEGTERCVGGEWVGCDVAAANIGAWTHPPRGYVYYERMRSGRPTGNSPKPTERGARRYFTVISA